MREDPPNFDDGRLDKLFLVFDQLVVEEGIRDMYELKRTDILEIWEGILEDCMVEQNACLDTGRIFRKVRYAVARTLCAENIHLYAKIRQRYKDE